MIPTVLIALNNGVRYLMVQHAQNRTHKGKWCFPSGKIKSMHFVSEYEIKKILFEESGYKANSLKFILESNNKINLFFCDDWIKETDSLSNKIIDGIGWFSIQEIFLLKDSLIPWFHEILNDFYFQTRHRNLCEQ